MSEVFILYMYRMFWALFLGALLAMGFRRSWNAEHGKMTSWMEDREHAVVWLDPIVFPVMIIFFAAINLWVYGSDDGVEYGLCLLIDIFVFVSVYFTGLMFLLPMLRRRYTARTCAVLWLVPVFLFYQPHMLYLMRSEPPLVVLYLPGILLRVLPAVWAAGFLVLFGTKIGSHIWFSRRLRQHSRPILAPELLEIWEKVRRDLDMHIPVDLRYCSLIRTPLTIGMRKKSKVTYLPERAYGAEEAELIFSHELHHVQRRDTHTKCFLEFCKALGWIHPLVWLAARRAQDDLELSCDEIVLEKADAVTRRKYAELLLSTAGDGRGFTTCLSASARTLRYRMRATVSGGKKKLGVVMLFTVMALSVLGMGKISVSTDRTSLAELIQLSEDSLSEVYLTKDGEEIQISDLEGLAGYLSSLQAERLIYTYTLLSEQGGCDLEGITSSDATFRMSGSYVEICYPEKRNPVLCRMKEPVDWQKIQAFE